MTATAIVTDVPEVNPGTLDDLLAALKGDAPPFGGTPDEFIERIKAFAKEHPDESSPRHVFEWARATWLPYEKGTLGKVGRWLFGDAYREQAVNALPSTREEQLAHDLKMEREAHRETQAQRSREMTWRKTLQEEVDRLRHQLDVQGAQLAALSETQRAAPDRAAALSRRPPRKAPPVPAGTAADDGD